MLFTLLQFIAVGQVTANAQSTEGIYSVTVNTPGSFGHVMLQAVDNWSDVVELTVNGHLSTSDMVYFSRMVNMTKLDLSQTDISSISGCEGLGLLQTVVLPESVIEIADNAFKDCTSLSTINLSKITEIGSSSFNNCKSLGENLILTNLKTVSDYAFQNCAGLKSVEMPVATGIGRFAFSMRDNSNSTMLTTVIIPNVTAIGYNAFQSCSKLQSIEIPNCTHLGFYDDSSFDYQGDCFSGCKSLSTVTLSDELKFIPNGTFQNTNLKSIKLPSKLQQIGRSAFESSKLSAIDIPEGVTAIQNYAFYDCPIETITLPSTLEVIEEQAFYYYIDKYNPETGSYDYSYSLKDVYCKCVVPIASSVFNNDMAKGATLHVPALSVSAYKLDDNWYKFNKIEPIEGDLSDITINNTFTIIDYAGLADNMNITLASSNLRQTVGHLTISADKPLSIGNFRQNHILIDDTDYYSYSTVNSYPYCTSLITNNEVRANNVTTKISLPTKQWSFISLPYDVNISSIVVPEGVMWVVRRYSGSNRAAMSGETWENLTAGQTLNAGEGYIFHCINDNNDSWEMDYVDFEFPAINNSNKNNLFTCDDVETTIQEYPSEFSHNRGWNLMGNPYPSYMDSRYIEFQAPITVWNGDGYTAYSLTDDDYILHPAEAFFVQCPLNTNRIKFLKEGRTHKYSTLIPDYPRAKAQSSDGRSILNFILAGENYSDRTRLVLNEAASRDYEIERDASKFMSSNESVPQIYIIDNGIHYSIDERPLGSGEYSLGVRIGKEGNYTISIDTNDTHHDILLTDKVTDETVNLSEKPYSFQSQALTIDSRFIVTVISKGDMSSIDDAMTTDEPVFTINGHQLSVGQASTVSIHSTDGKLIYNGTIEGSLELPTGIYLLSINNRTHKIAIK